MSFQSFDSVMKGHEGKMFPIDGRDETITCMSLTQDFLIYGTEVSQATWEVIECRNVNKNIIIMPCTGTLFPQKSHPGVLDS